MLEAVDRQITHLLSSLDEPIVQRLYANLLGGKRVRATLVLTIAHRTKSAIDLAAIIELVHAASLLHDDVIDEATLRRNRPSINALFGNKSAIMLGDILYATAFQALGRFDRRIIDSISGAVVQLSIGELVDVELSKHFVVDRQRYLKMIYQKTASLIEATTASAAILANKDPKLYALYGKKIGLAFQMIDDLLDITSDEHRLGKPAFSDYKEGKTTLAFIYLYEALPADEKVQLAAMHGRDIGADAIDWIRTKMVEYGALQRAKEEAEAVANEAVEIAKRLDEPKLIDMAKTVVQRSR